MLISVAFLILFCIGLLSALRAKNIIKIFLSLAISESALFLYFIGMHYQTHRTAPIFDAVLENTDALVDPLPQAIVLTAIIISISVLALALSFVRRYYSFSQNLELDQMDSLGEKRC